MRLRQGLGALWSVSCAPAAGFRGPPAAGSVQPLVPLEPARVYVRFGAENLCLCEACAPGAIVPQASVCVFVPQANVCVCSKLMSVFVPQANVCVCAPS